MSNSVDAKVEPRTSLSFGFTKTSGSKKLADSKLRDVSTKDLKKETDFIVEVNRDKGIKGSIVKEIKPDLVIPCTGNTYKSLGSRSRPPTVGKEPLKKGEDGTNDLTDEELAAIALIQDSEKWKEDQEKEFHPNDGLVVALQASKNVIVDEKAEFEADVSQRPDVSSQEDYESVPVEGFGMGMLRGMGFVDGQGIGGFKKANVACIEPVIRPKGLGLGASRPSKTSSKSNDDGSTGEDEKLEVKPGAYVLLESGQNRGKYGQVEGLDEETARVIVRLALGQQNVISVSENAIRPVSKREYKDYSKVINRDQYEKSREKARKQEIEWDRGKQAKRQVEESSESSKKSCEKPRDPETGHSGPKRPKGSSWIRPLLRVRIIDRKSRYKEKVIVDDVAGPEEIVCRTDRGCILDGVDPGLCETVIPKNECSLVMVVRGENRGQLAEVLRRDTKRGVAVVRLLPDKDLVLKVDYDDICEYTGDVHDVL